MYWQLSRKQGLSTAQKKLTDKYPHFGIDWSKVYSLSSSSSMESKLREFQYKVPFLCARFSSLCMFLNFDFIKNVKKQNKTKQTFWGDFSNNHPSNYTKTIVHPAFGEQLLNNTY